MTDLRKMNVDDVDACLSIYIGSQPKAISGEFLDSLGISAESISSALASGRVLGIVCCYGGRSVGFVLLDSISGGVLALAVSKKYQGQGYGRKLMCSAIQTLRLKGFEWTWVYASPDPQNRALGFYKRLGLRPTGDVDEFGNEALAISTHAQIPSRFQPAYQTKVSEI